MGWLELTFLCADGQAKLVRLADGLQVWCAAQREAAFLHHEIFKEQAYCRGGISMPDCGVVVDVGANIGGISGSVPHDKKTACPFPL